MFSGIPTITFEASIAVCQVSQLVSARVLDDFRGISCFVIFSVARAVLETLPSHMHLVALWSPRAAVKSRHIAATFVLWLRRLHELANPWKRFKCLVMCSTNVSRSFGANLVTCSVAWCFASARGRVWCPASARGRGSPSLRETLLVRLPREALLHKSRSVVKFCDILSILAFSLHAWSLFFSVPWLRCLCTHPTWLRALDLLCFCFVSLPRDSANQNMSHRDWYQRYPASITSVIQRIDTFAVVAELLHLQPYSVGLCETHSLSRPRGTLSIIDRRRSDGGIGTCTLLQKEYGSGSWLWRLQTHTYLERERCEVGIIPVRRLGENLDV